MGEELPEKLLVHLDSLSVVDSQTLSQKFGQDHQRIVGAIKSLEALGKYFASHEHVKYNVLVVV